MNAADLKKLTTESLKQLASMLDEGHSERLTSLLTTMARFHRYSLNNICLIVAQRPTATHVAGFHTWRTLGRFVRKGEKGIAIMAPIIARRREDANEDEPRTIMGFRAAYVFDVEQTDGAPLPQPATIGGDPGDKTACIKAAIASRREVYRSQQYGTAVYRSELASRLRNLGYEIQIASNGTPEIKGYSREYLEANSLRSQQIREHLNAAGRSGAAAAQIAAHRTREAKVTLTRDEVKNQHKDLAAKFGNEPERVVREARTRGERHDHDAGKHAHMAVTYARDKTFEREAVVDRRDLMKEALKRSYGNASFDQVRKAFDERARSGDFIHVDRQRQSSPSQSYTTPATIANERRNIEFMRQGQGKHEPLVSSRVRQDANLASGQSSALVNERFAYVAGSRMRDGLDIYTDDASRLESSMSRQFDKSAALSDRTTDQAQSHRGVGAAQNTNAPAQHSQSQEGVRQEQGHAH